MATNSQVINRGEQLATPAAHDTIHGLTIREEFAARNMASLLSNPDTVPVVDCSMGGASERRRYLGQIAGLAVDAADALLLALHPDK